MSAWVKKALKLLTKPTPLWIRLGYTDADIQSMQAKMNGSPLDDGWRPPLDYELTRAEQRALTAQMRQWAGECNGR